MKISNRQIKSELLTRMQASLNSFRSDLSVLVAIDAQDYDLNEKITTLYSLTSNLEECLDRCRIKNGDPVNEECENFIEELTRELEEADAADAAAAS